MSARVTITLDELVQLKADAHGFSFLPRQPVSSLLAGRHASRLRGRGLAFEELRHYNPGDDVRTIDWKATARLRSTYVRVYSEERERPVLLVVDQRRPMFFGSRRAMKSVTAAEVAALGAWRVLNARDRVGGIVFNEAEIVDISPHRSQTQVMRMLHEVVRLNHALAEKAAPTGAVTLNHALEAALRRAKHDHLVVLISDFDGADEATQRLATLIAAHNDMLAVAIYDPLGASLQPQPGMVVEVGGARVVLPPAVPWWPLAPGWYLVIALALVAVMWMTLRAWRQWQSNAYRREAARELASLESSAAIAELLRRTALAIAPRSEIAEKTGTAWLDWLTAQFPEPMPDTVRTQLTVGVYNPSPAKQEFSALRDYAARWIKFHHSPPC